MPPQKSSRSKKPLIGALLLAAGVLAGWLDYRAERAALVTTLRRHAQTASVAFAGSDLPPLAPDNGPAAAGWRARARARLAQLAAADPQVRIAYLLQSGHAPARVELLADSAPATRGTSRVLDAADAEGHPSPGLRAVIEGAPSGLAGPVRDGAGSWLTAYARVPGGAPATAPAEILALQVSAAPWTRALGLAAIRGAVYAWVLLGLPVFGFLARRRAGEQREAIRNLSEAVEQSHSAILILDLEQRIEFANRGVCQQLGYARRELIGRHWRDALTAPPSRPTIADLIATVESGCAWEGEWTNRRKDGTEYPVHGMVTPVKLRDGALACFVVIFDDVTEVKRTEADLREARDQAEAADRAKGQFLATMSHEVRTPLNGIVGFTSLLLETPLSAEQREFVQTIRASGEALIQLTGDILDYARIESGKLKLDPIACDPRECIEEALDLHAAKAAEKNVELLHRAADDVPAAVVVDGGRLRQVLVNLVGNAVKFTDQGEVEVAVRVVDPAGAADDGAPTPVDGHVPGAAPSCVLEFTIRDTGIGIAAHEHPRLFKPFSQIDESSTRRYGGAGLGLAISKNLVHLMGGEITLASAPGRGTTFTFSIRAVIAAAQPPERNLDGLRLALVVPPGSLRRELTTLLQSWGARVTEAATVADAADADWDLALVELSEPMARELAAQRAFLLPPEKTFALVPISLAPELRAPLRAHFRMLVNRPVHHAPLFALLSGSRPAAEGRGGATTQFGFRVLVVEDNSVNQRLLERVLESLGCTWQVVNNGRRAMEELAERADQYDLVLLDLHMPELDGLSALERIRRGEAGPRAQTMWFIAITADARPEQRTRGFAVGLNDYLTKPLRVPDLDAALRRFRTERLARKT